MRCQLVVAAVLGTALQDERIDFVLLVDVALARDGAVAVALLGVLQTAVARSTRSSTAHFELQYRTFHQMSSGTMASMFLILSSGIHWSHCIFRVKSARRRSDKVKRYGRTLWQRPSVMLER